MRRKKSTEREMQEYLLLNYPQDVRNNLKKLIKMPRDEELQKSDNKREGGARSKKKGNSRAGSGREDFVEMPHRSLIQSITKPGIVPLAVSR